MRDILRVLAITVAISSIGFGQEYQRNKYVEGSGIAADAAVSAVETMTYGTDSVPVVGPIVGIGFSAYEAYDIEKQYNAGNISDRAREKAHVKNGVGTGAGIAGGMAGAATGAAVGTAICPVFGTAVGGVIGGVGGGLAGGIGSKKGAEWVVEQAYKEEREEPLPRPQYFYKRNLTELPITSYSDAASNNTELHVQWNCKYDPQVFIKRLASQGINGCYCVVAKSDSGQTGYDTIILSPNGTLYMVILSLNGSSDQEINKIIQKQLQLERVLQPSTNEYTWAKLVLTKYKENKIHFYFIDCQ